MNNFLHIIRIIFIGLGTGLMVSIPLGPAGIESVNRTLSKGLKSGLLVALGAITADASYIILINYGLWNFFCKSKKTEALFWIISGAFLIFINLATMIKRKRNSSTSKKHSKIYDKFCNYGFIVGFVITFSNPLTPSLWITISSTVLKKWHSISHTYYYILVISILLGMIIWFSLLNILAYKGLKYLAPNSTSLFANLLKWIILALGFCFVGLGLFKLFNIVI